MNDLKQFKYWLRINGFRPEQFGTGTRWNLLGLILKKHEGNAYYKDEPKRFEEVGLA